MPLLSMSLCCASVCECVLSCDPVSLLSLPSGETPALFYSDEHNGTVWKATVFLRTLDCLGCVCLCDTCVRQVDIPDMIEAVKLLSLLFFLASFSSFFFFVVFFSFFFCLFCVLAKPVFLHECYCSHLHCVHSSCVFVVRKCDTVADKSVLPTRS